MEIIQLKDNPTIAALVRLVSKKRKAFLKRQNAVMLDNNFWDGGSRSDYFLVDTRSMRVTSLAHTSPPQFGGLKAAAIQQIESGFAVIEAGVFCGKPATPTVYLPLE